MEQAQPFSFWSELPIEVARVLRPRLGGIASEMIDAIRREVPGYRRPLDSSFGHDLVTAVQRALNQFVELVEDPHRAQTDNVLFFRGLGRSEFRNGRGMDHLQAAYRIGARVACRRYTRIAQAAALPTETVLMLSEAVLIHINAMANESVKGYTAARERSAADRLSEARRMLADRLLDQRSPATAESVGEAADRAHWPVPATIGCVLAEPLDGNTWHEPATLDAAVLVLTRGHELILLVPDPDTGDRLDQVRAALRGTPAVLGPTVGVSETWLSLHCARAAAKLVRRRLIPSAGELITAVDHLGAIMLSTNEHLVRLLAKHTMAELADLAALSRGKAMRLEETLDALLSSWGRTAPEVATVLGVHPQTARNRIRQLETLLGDRLTDPAFRLEAQVVLRIRALLRGAGGRAGRLPGNSPRKISVTVS